LGLWFCHWNALTNFSPNTSTSRTSPTRR